jgi:DNA polymerase III subunit delta'
MPFLKESALNRLQAAFTAGRLGHAYLLTGPIGSGKSWLAQQLAALRVECPAGKALVHPDVHSVRPESKSRRIVIDQIRELEQSVQRKPLVASGKAVIIYDADRLQPQAANAFLKTLEEPPPNSLILLLSSLPEAMLETVLSRCVEVPLLGPARPPSGEEEQAILRAIDECLIKPAQPGATEAFRFTRAIQALLAEARERISDENDGLLKEETSRYKQAADGSSWLKERTEQMKSLTEASALRERDRLLQIVLDILSRALRAQHGQPDDQAAVRALAEKFDPKNLLQRIDAMETTRRRLAMGVQEALSLESGFLEMVVIR